MKKSSTSPSHLNPALTYRPVSLPSVEEVLELFGKSESESLPAKERLRLQVLRSRFFGGSNSEERSDDQRRQSQVNSDEHSNGRQTPNQAKVVMLSKCITILESETVVHKKWAAELIELISQQENKQPSFRLGISGSPGVGKSTFIEAFGLELIRLGHQVAVLAVDPSSQLSGGSILGDKTRMEELGRHPNAYVRPSPSSGFLGGVSRVTRESILLCEAAGFDYILVETVGVGQSEMAVHGMTDAFLLLAQPGAGDELQGIKRGILEMADLLVVNKMDILPKEVAQTAAELRRSLHLAPARTSGWSPPVISIAALTKHSIYEVYQLVEKYRLLLTRKNELAVKRREQRKNWLEEVIQTELLSELARSKATQTAWKAMNQRIDAGETSVHQFAAEILRIFRANLNLTDEDKSSE